MNTIEDFEYGSMMFSDYEKAFARLQSAPDTSQKLRALRQLAYQLRRQNWSNECEAKARKLAKRISSAADNN